MEEIWKDVVGFEGLYQISNLGRLISLERIHTDRTIGEKILKYRTNNKGYICIDLYDGETKTNKKKLVHRLMAEAFIPNSDKNKTEVNHKNGIRLHNFIDPDDLHGAGTNLEWSTPKDNLDDRHKRQKDFKAMRLAERGVKAEEKEEKKAEKVEKETKAETKIEKKSKGGSIKEPKGLNRIYSFKDLFR